MKNSTTIKSLASLALASVFATSGWAQAVSSENPEPNPTNPGIEITRDATELRDIIAVPPADRDFIDTAVVLTDTGGPASVAWCVAYNEWGQVVGRGYTRVPRNGVRLILASDLSNGLDYFGKIKCKSRDRMLGSAFIIGPDFSDTKVHHLYDRAGTLMSIPVSISR